MKCRNCNKQLDGQIFFRNNVHTCNEECFDQYWQEKGADLWAYSESDGLHSSYEDYMRYEFNATIVGDYDMPIREI